MSSLPSARYENNREVNKANDLFDATDILPGLDDAFDGLNEDFVDDFIVGDPTMYQRDYIPPSMVAKFAALPRFSHSNDISFLFSDVEGAGSHYALGLLFVGCFIVSILTFWCLTLVLLKCLGPRRVGVFAGFPYKFESWKSVSGRVTLSVSSLMVILCTILLITQGLNELQGLSDTLDRTNADIQKIESEAIVVIENIQQNARQAIPIRDGIVAFLSKQDLCPLTPGTPVETYIRGIGAETQTAMTNLDDFVTLYLTIVRKAVSQISVTTNKIDGIVAQTQFQNAPKVTAILFPYMIVPAFLLVAVCMGWYDVFSEAFYTFITWLILPLIILMTVTAIVAAGWMAIALQGNSDFCAPNPEQNIYHIMNRIFPAAAVASASAAAAVAATTTTTTAAAATYLGSLQSLTASALLEPNGAFGEVVASSPLAATTTTTTTSMLAANITSDQFYYDVILFYTNQCDTTKVTNPWSFLENHYDALGKSRNVLSEFLRTIDETTLQQLSQVCGQEFAPLVELLEQLQTHITALSKASVRALNVMSCPNIVPLYTNAVYDATCHYSVIGATWVFSCTVLIAFFGLLCIMFRGAYYPLGYYYYDAGDGEKSIYGTSEDESEVDPNEPIPGDEEETTNNHHEQYDGRDRSAAIEAFASLSQMDTIDGDVYECIENVETNIDDYTIDDNNVDVDDNISPMSR